MKKALTLGIFLVLAAGLCTIPVFLTFGQPAATDMDRYFVEHGQSQAAANNIVTSIVFDYRGFDTLGESVVLFTAVIGVGLLFRSMKGGEEHEDE
ncbi:MAG: hypothetical protein MUC66_05750 [Methanolinea sp.]|jgi:multisubunit Na+/H+ antiporter MnhB subunit|nr:hypothetical protein [Methanolinea sp.]